MQYDIFRQINRVIDILKKNHIKASSIEDLVYAVTYDIATDANNGGIQDQIILLFQHLGENAIQAISMELGISIDIPKGPTFWDVNHPDHPRSDWQAEVEAGDTQLGYHDWLIHQIEGKK